MEKINKVIVTMIGISAILIAIVIVLMVSRKSPDNLDEGNIIKIGEVIYDECTEEYEEMGDEIVETNTEEEKTSPNCKMTFIKCYKKCGDKINEYLTIPNEYVNLTKNEIQDKYKDWEIKEFSSNQIMLYKEIDGECGEHYVLRDKGGKINIYKINQYGKEEEYETTEISTDYLPEKDKNEIKKGQKVNGKEKLNELIESFE